MKNKEFALSIIALKLNMPGSCLYASNSAIISSIVALFYLCEKTEPWRCSLVADITKDQVKHVAHLARLEITEEEAEQFTEHLSAIITYAEKLNELDTEGIEPTTHVLDLKNVFRKDEAKHTITQEDAMKNAPDSEDGQFRVPSILE